MRAVKAWLPHVAEPLSLEADGTVSCVRAALRLAGLAAGAALPL